MNPINATKMDYTTTNHLIDTIVAYNNVDPQLVQDKGLSYTDLKYSRDEFQYFEGLIKHLMECYSKSTSDFNIADQNSMDQSGNVITSRIFYFGFTNAKMSDYNNRILRFTQLAGDFPIDRTLASSPNKVCTFAFLIFEDLSFSIIAFNNCNNDSLRKPLTGSDYAVIDTDLKKFESDLNNGRIKEISNLNNENKKELAILASKINIYLRYVLSKSKIEPDTVCNDFLKASPNDQSSQSSQTTSSSDNNRCDPKTNPCCKDDGTLKAIGDECFDSSIISDCLTHCIGIKYKSACQENENQELECSLTTIPIDDNLNSVVYAPRNTICNENSDGTSSFVLVSSSNHCYSSLGCEQEQPLTAYYGCDGQGSCSVATFQPIGSVCSGETPNCCNGVCVNYENDHLNCGSCGNSCSAGLICLNRVCSEPEEQGGCSNNYVPSCPDYCEDNVHYYDGFCTDGNTCEYQSETVTCCSNEDCIENANFRCVRYTCTCRPFNINHLEQMCKTLQCGNIPDGCGGLFSCGECDDNDPCTKDNCDLINNKCEYEPISCDDGKECLEGECVSVDSQEEGNSVVDDTSSEDLVENKDEEQSSSQPLQTHDCEIEFGKNAITLSAREKCMSLGGVPNWYDLTSMFQKYKRSGWYTDSGCPEKEYTYYKVSSVENSLVEYYCRDTKGCNEQFNLEAGIALDCSQFAGSACYDTYDESGTLVNECSPHCVKAIDCRVGELKVTTGIDNSEGYKELGCGYMPKGTSCTGENRKDGTCDGNGRCIPFECNNDEECNEGFICYNHKCIEEIEPESDYPYPINNDFIGNVQSINSDLGVVNEYSKLIQQFPRVYSAAYDLALDKNMDPSLIMAIVTVEGGFNSQYNKKDSETGELITDKESEKICIGDSGNSRGPMHIYYNTFDEYGPKLGYDWNKILEYKANILLGIEILQTYTKRTNGNFVNGLLSYNLGPTAFRRLNEAISKDGDSPYTGELAVIKYLDFMFSECVKKQVEGKTQVETICDAEKYGILEDPTLFLYRVKAYYPRRILETAANFRLVLEKFVSADKFIDATTHKFVYENLPEYKNEGAIFKKNLYVYNQQSEGITNA